MLFCYLGLRGCYKGCASYKMGEYAPNSSGKRCRGRHCLIALPWGQNRRYSCVLVEFWSYFHGKGLLRGCTCARASCIPPPYVIDHRITFTELYRYTNFHVASSKNLEIRGLVSCTCVARAQCTTTPQVMLERIALVELYQCTKFRVASSKFPESESAYAYA